MRSRFSYILLGAALAVLALGVTGPAVLEEPAALPVTPYGAVVTLAALAGIVLMDLAGKRYSRVLPGGACTDAVFLFSGFAGARLLYCLFRLSYYKEIGFLHVLMTREGGFLLYGALLGIAAAAWFMTRRERLRIQAEGGEDGPAAALRRVQGGGFAEAMDELTLPGLCVIALCRLAEGFAGEGLGDWVEEGFFCRLPFAAPNAYGEYQWALFIPEAVAALCILFACRNVPAGKGTRAKHALLLYAACQIVFESLRMDSVLKIGFVRVSQVLSAVMILLILLSNMKEKGNGLRWAPVLLFGCLVAAVGGIEWALDKTALPNGVLYALMAAACAGMAAVAQRG